jgi:hypothetical protein
MCCYRPCFDPVRSGLSHPVLGQANRDAYFIHPVRHQRAGPFQVQFGLNGRDVLAPSFLLTQRSLAVRS